VSVVGFNDMAFAEWFTPPLTTIRFSHYDAGRTAAELLMGQIRNHDGAPRTLVLPTQLIERGSTAAPGEGAAVSRAEEDAAAIADRSLADQSATRP
jgi:LacI family transcriptional regulator